MAAISLHPVDKPEKKLGVYVCPNGDFTYHVDQLWQTGLEYASRLQSWNLPPRDSWMGTHYQLYPKLIYGAVALTHNPDKLDAAFQAIWYHLLPSSRVNRPITKEFFTLPLHFQVLALPSLKIDVLSTKIHLIRKHWGKWGDVTGNMLALVYLIFQTEVGIGGDVLFVPVREIWQLGNTRFLLQPFAAPLSIWSKPKAAPGQLDSGSLGRRPPFYGGGLGHRYHLICGTSGHKYLLTP